MNRKANTRSTSRVSVLAILAITLTVSAAMTLIVPRVVAAQESVLGQWDLKCCNDGIGWLMTIDKQSGGTFSGVLSADAWGGLIQNGIIRGDVIEFDRVGGDWRQHWTGRLVRVGGGLQMVDGVWSGSFVENFVGRTNWRAVRRGGAAGGGGGAGPTGGAPSTGACGPTPPPGTVGEVWREAESGWTGVWNRVGKTNEYDAKFTTSNGVMVTSKLLIFVDRRNVSIFRWNPGTWGICNYTGTFAPDFGSVSGTYQCTNEAGTWTALYPWNATVSRS